MSGQNTRFDWVDTAKGLGIILVVIAHVWTKGPVRDFIYSFHMPLFFLLSGYMSKPRPMFERVDANKDGVIDQAEMAAAKKDHKHGRGMGPEAPPAQ